MTRSAGRASAEMPPAPGIGPDREPLVKLSELDLLTLPGHLLRRCHQRSQEIFVRNVGDDVTRQQVALLVALSQSPGASQRDLAEATGIDKSTLQEMLGRMVSRGWMTRERDDRDGRAWVLQITAQGRDLLLERMAAFAATQRDILAPLAEADRAIFISMLRTLIGVERA